MSKLPLMTVNSIAEYFANELVSVEDLGECARLVFAVPRQVGREAFREPVVSVIVPTALLPLMAKRLIRPPLEIKDGNVDAERTEFDPEPAVH